MVDRDRIELEGIVAESNKGQFKVKVNDNLTVLCTLGGKIRVNSVKILVGAFGNGIQWVISSKQNEPNMKALRFANSL